MDPPPSHKGGFKGICLFKTPTIRLLCIEEKAVLARNGTEKGGNDQSNCESEEPVSFK
jgi:hypothetical protein